MNISILDFILINFVSYIFGIGTGLIICCKNKDKLLVKSRSLDNLQRQQNQIQQAQHSIQQEQYTPPPLIASAPASIEKSPVKITVE